MTSDKGKTIEFTHKKRYYQPSLPRSLGDEIDNLFKQSPQTQRFFGGNKVKFVEDAIRRNILYWKEQDKEAGT